MTSLMLLVAFFLILNTSYSFLLFLLFTFLEAGFFPTYIKVNLSTTFYFFPLIIKSFVIVTLLKVKANIDSTKYLLYN